MRITIREGAVLPVVRGERKYAPPVYAAILAEVARMEAMDVIKPCDDIARQSIVMAPKPDAPSSYRFCMDATEVNAAIVPEPFNPAPIPTLIQELAGCAFLSRLDLASAYWQFR